MAAEEVTSDAAALWQAFVMIVVSEIGDKTFLIAAIMATRHPRITVFLGAFASLVVMSILSAAMGRVILGLIPKVWTLWAASLLFLVFGLKMLQEGMTMRSGTSHIQEEMREVEEELEEDSSRHDTQNPRGGSSVPLEALEEGKVDMDMGMGYEGGRGSFSSGSRNRDGSPASPRRFSSTTMGYRPSSPRSSTAGLPRHAHAPARGPSINFPLSGSGGGHSSYDGNGNGKKALKSWIGGLKEGSRNAIQLMTNPVFAQAFVLTFLGEWGDRSQITTIAMGGAHSIPVIAFGTILGHGLCTFGAVMGGRYLSTKISVRHITFLGCGAFLIFAILYALEAYSTPWEAVTGLVEAL